MKNLAVKYHAGQFRKGNDALPYIVHPEAVVETLLSWGEAADSPAIAIAWGHDLLEDTTVSEAEILAASDETVLSGIRQLTHAAGTNKAAYLEKLAQTGSREVILVKMADRISNSKDFIALEGELRAYRYLHAADCLFDSWLNWLPDPVISNAREAFENLSACLEPKALLEAFRGCFIGGAVGDALGAPVEFGSREDIIRIYGSEGVRDYVEFSDGTGSITDDTQMALFTAEGILRAHTCYVNNGILETDIPGIVEKAYFRWLETQGVPPPGGTGDLHSGWLIKEKRLWSRRAPGMTCVEALRNPRPDHKAKNNSKGCGTVMRMAPVGMFHWFDPVRAYQEAAAYSAITHGHPTGIIAGGAFAMLIAWILKGKSLEESLERTDEFLSEVPDSEETRQALQKARCASCVAELGEGWIAEEALAIGVYCALKHPRDFRSGVAEAVNITGDSDSTGAIAGNLLGAMNGLHSIPADLRENLREYDIVDRMAWDLFVDAADDSLPVSRDIWDKRYPGF